MMPNTPSEPINSWRRSGPAADSGARPRSSTPAGVTARRPRTMSLKRPYPAESCPDERVAANPPIVANWKLCGKCPSEKPRSPSRRSASGPVTPAPSSASPETSSRECSSFSRRRSSDITALNSPRSGSSPPTTLVPPPNGTTAMLRCPQQPQDRGNLVFVAGQQHRIRRVLDSGILASQQVKRGLAACAQQPGTVVDAAVLGPDDLGQRVAVGGRQRGRPQPDLVRLQLGNGRVPDAERLFQQAANPVGERLGRLRVTPCVPLHRGNRAVRCSSGLVMRYSITYAVNQ